MRKRYTTNTENQMNFYNSISAFSRNIKARDQLEKRGGAVYVACFPVAVSSRMIEENRSIDNYTYTHVLNIYGSTLLVWDPRNKDNSLVELNAGKGCDFRKSIKTLEMLAHEFNQGSNKIAYKLKEVKI